MRISCLNWIHNSKTKIWWASCWLGSKEPACQCRRLKRPSSIPGSGRSPREWNGKLTPVFLPGKFHGQRIVAGYSPWGHKESNITEQAHMHACNMWWDVLLLLLHLALGIDQQSDLELGNDSLWVTSFPRSKPVQTRLTEEPQASSLVPQTWVPRAGPRRYTRKQPGAGGS